MAATPAAQLSLEALAGEIRDLQRRVSALEQRAGAAPAAPETAPPEPLVSSDALPDTAALLPLCGKALLGLAAAYLLRALAEMRVLPVPAGVNAGVLYALAWLVLAARVPANERARAGIYALTSVMIVVPLLWEARMRFQAAPSWVVAGLLTFWSVFGLGVSWRKNVSVVAWITVLAGVLSSSVLLVATHDLLPFTLALLALAAAGEISACLEHWLDERWVAATAANIAVVLLTYITTRPGGMPETYAPVPAGAVIGMQIALAVIYLSSMAVRTLVRGFLITGFEVVQCVLAFAIAITGALRAAQGHFSALLAISLFCLAAGAGCYFASFAFMERKGRRDANFHTYALFALLLVSTGTVLMLRGLPMAALLAALATAAAWTGRRAGRVTLSWHAAAYLVLAGILTGVIVTNFRRFLLGSGDNMAGPPPLAAWLTAAAAVAAYWLAVLAHGSDEGGWNRRVAVGFLGLTAAWSVAGIAAGLAPGGEFAATALTGILTVIAVALAYLNGRVQASEALAGAYVFMAVATYKLLVQDLPDGRALTIVASLLFYGTALVVLPRVSRKAA